MKDKLQQYIEENGIEIESDVSIYEKLGEPDKIMEIEVENI